jgi:HK97 family phage portal protein
MGIFNWGKSPETKQAMDVDSPRLMELIRQGDSYSSTVSPEAAMRLSTVYACIKVLSDTISTLPCYLYKKDGDARIVLDNKLHSLVSDAPNDFQTAREFWQQQVTNICLRGNSYSYVTRTAQGKVVEIVPLPVDSCAVNIMAQNQISYTITLGDEGNVKTFIAKPENILHFKNLTLDGIQGLSPIGYNGSLLSNALAARDHANSVYTNGATPRGVLETEGVLSDEAFENLKASWSSNHNGSSNANKVAILESGLQFKPVSMSPADVQLLESRKYSRSEIAGMFRVPPHMIGDLDRATYSNIGHQSLDFYKSAISPWLAQFEARLNFSLLGTSTSCFRFDVSELIRGDIETEVASYRSLLEMGVLSPNEVRGKLGMNPRDGGDDYVTQSNNLTFGDDADSTEG